MEQDIAWKNYFSDDERYADIINGIACGGSQKVTKGDLQELDTQTYLRNTLRFISRIRQKRHSRKTKVRDMLRKTAFGMNFAIIGIENQNRIDYSMPLRAMTYDAGEYGKQAAAIRREIRRNHAAGNGEYLYGFRKDSRLKPVITFILYSGEEEWEGSERLHDMLDFTDIPDELKEMTPDYKINLIEIRKLKDTSIFKTDVRQVFDLIRCSDDKDKIRALVMKDEYYQNMEEDAYDVAVHCTNATQLIGMKEYYRAEGGKINMCKAITDLIEEGREEGIREGIQEGIEEGRNEAMTIIAIRMLAAEKYEIDEISSISGLSINEVSQLGKKKV